MENAEPLSTDDLLPLVYDELRRLAAQKLAREAPGQTLQATALVHEAYLRLAGGERPVEWDGRGHFFAAAGEAMRRILVERARQRASLKRGGGRGRRQVELDQLSLTVEEPPEEILALDEALSELEQHDGQAARLVKLRYFAGLSHQEAAQALGVTRRTADRVWALAKAWLFERMRQS